MYSFPKAVRPHSPSVLLRNGKIAIAALVIIGLIIWLTNVYADYSLRKHLVVTNGCIIKTSKLTKGGYVATFLYSYKSVVYRNTTSLSIFNNPADLHFFIGKTFPVVLDSSNPSRVKMLFDSSAFAYYRLAYPDNMQWLKPYLKL